MKTKTRNSIRSSVLVPLVLVCFALAPAPNAFGVSPTPDGGYGGSNTAEGGPGALFSLTTGTDNTALGYAALYSLTTGVQNTATGAQALKNNTADQNTADGFQALNKNTTGTLNTATGWRALFANTTASGNTADGYQALYYDTTGSLNTATGRLALLSNTTGEENTAMGASALKLNRIGSQNVAVGRSALFNNTSGSFNNAFGYNAMSSNTDGYENTAIGDCGLMANTIGHDNQSLGQAALINNTSGKFNVAAGSFAVAGNTTGELNVGLGSFAGFNLTTGNNNIDIANLGVAGESNTIRIGEPVAVTAPGPSPAPTLPAHTATYIAGIFGKTSSGGTAVFINSEGKLGTTTSSKRFKQDIKPMDKASETLLGLKPVTFRYKKEIDPAGTPQFGLVAEEVAKVNADLVVRDKEGKPYTVRYDQVNAMLLNEFLKEHQKVQRLEAALAAVNERLKAEDAKIDKVNAKVELSKPAPRMADNNQQSCRVPTSSRFDSQRNAQPLRLTFTAL